MVFPSWPQYTPADPGPPPVPAIPWIGRNLNPYDPKWMYRSPFNYSFPLAEGFPHAVLGDPMYNNTEWNPSGIVLSSSVWDAFNTSTQANLGTAQEPSRSMGFPLRWGLSRGIKFKTNGGMPPVPPP